MVRLWGSVALVGILLSASTAIAAAKTRVGTLDMKKAFLESRAGKQARERLKKDFDKKQQQLDTAQEEVKKLLAQAASENDKAKREAASKKAEDRARALQGLFERYQRELEDAQKAATAKLVGDIKAIIPGVARSHNLVAVTESETLYFTAPDVERVDVTQEVIRRLDAGPAVRHGAVAPPAAVKVPVGKSVPKPPVKAQR